ILRRRGLGTGWGGRVRLFRGRRSGLLCRPRHAQEEQTGGSNHKVSIDWHLVSLLYSSARWLRAALRSNSALNSQPIRATKAITYIHTSSAIPAPIDPYMTLYLAILLAYQPNPEVASIHSTVVRMAPGHTYRQRCSR